MEFPSNYKVAWNTASNQSRAMYQFLNQLIGRIRYLRLWKSRFFIAVCHVTQLNMHLCVVWVFLLILETFGDNLPYFKFKAQF